MSQQLSQGQQRAVHRLQAGDTGEAPLRLLKQAVVPLNTVPRLALLHQHQACTQRSHRRLPHVLTRVAQRVPDDLDEGSDVDVEDGGRILGQLPQQQHACKAQVLLARRRQPLDAALDLRARVVEGGVG